MSLVIRPSADRVIIDPDSEEERRVGGIIIPQTSWQEYHTGIVVAVGPGPTGEHGSCPMTSKVGDRVVYPPSLGRKVPVVDTDGVEHEYVVIRQHEIAVTVDAGGGKTGKVTRKK